MLGERLKQRMLYKHKRLISCAAALTVFFGMTAVFAPVSAADVSAKAAVLIEASSGDVVFEKNADIRLPMASTTKIMTAVAALENHSPDAVVTVNEKACGVEGSSVYLKPGEKLTMEELLYALLLESANDAAAAIAYEVSGDIPSFAALMNETAAKIGLTDSHFMNPHGLDCEGHYTTAHDLAKLTAYALQNEKFREIVSTYKHNIPYPGEESGGVRVLLNHNKLLKLCDDVIGVKTGFTKKSGRCLVSAAERDGVCLIAVTLNAPDDWNDHRTMLELGFSEYSSALLADKGQFRVTIPAVGASGENGITAENRDVLRVTVKKGDVITNRIDAPHIILTPVCEGDEVGRVVFFKNGAEIGSVPLYSAENTEIIYDKRKAKQQRMNDNANSQTAEVRE